MTRSEGLQVFWVGCDSCSSARIDGDMSVLELSWEAASCNGHFCLKEMDAVSLVAFSVVRLAELGCSKLSSCPLCVRSRCCSQKQCWHFLVARFCQVFVSQLIYLCLLPTSLRCWNDFFLSRLETFYRLWIWTGCFRPLRPDVFLTQSVFLFTSPFSSAWWSGTAWVSSWNEHWLHTAGDCPGQDRKSVV